MADRWTDFCIVGFGGHARNRLLPALTANGQRLAGVVTRKDLGDAIHARCFNDLALAIESLPADTAFIIASPPSAHFFQASEVLRAGRDVIVEKPAFSTAAEARAAAMLAQDRGAILVEGFMNREAQVYRRFVSLCATEMPDELEIRFTIPQLPEGTFRSTHAIDASTLYDVASYAIALLADLGLPGDDLRLQAVDQAGSPDRECLYIAGQAAATRVTVRAGVAQDYVNTVTGRWPGHRQVAMAPAFYGRAGRRLWQERRGDDLDEHWVEEPDAFQTMFATPRSAWRASAGDRMDRLVQTCSTLERLGRTLAEFRAGRPSPMDAARDPGRG